jgi:hypothetical protein
MHHLVFFTFISLLTLTACQKADYESLKARELKTGKRHDDLLLGLHFGDTRDTFFTRCFAMNREGLITNGPKNMTALYVMPEFKETPVDLNFYPDFCQGRICTMRMYFNYQAWAPWNKQYHADKLLPKVLDWLESKYSTSFTKMKVGEKTRMVSIEGNREIKVWLQDEQTVNCLVTDLTAIPDPSPNVSPDAVKPGWMVQ